MAVELQGHGGTDFGTDFAGGTVKGGTVNGGTVNGATLYRVILILALSCASFCPAWAAGDDPTPGALDEILVTGERPGPGMWHVRHGSADVWLLGSLSP